MGTTIRYIQNPEETAFVIEWFSSIKEEIEIQKNGNYIIIYFKKLGEIILENGKINSQLSPVVSVFIPRIVNKAIWTVGEVHFLTKDLSTKFPKLNKIQNDFKKWIKQNECIFDGKNQSEYSYYLEGSLQNFNIPIYAFSSGMTAIKSDQYFVNEDISKTNIEDINKKLKLRGKEI
jgi:hypothetical protein